MTMQRALIASAALALLSVPALACEWQSTDRDASAAPRTLMAQAADPARPGRGPQSESAVPNAAPAATTTQTTAATNQPAKVKQMNEAEEKKVEKTGK